MTFQTCDLKRAYELSKVEGWTNELILSYCQTQARIVTPSFATNDGEDTMFGLVLAAQLAAQVAAKSYPRVCLEHPSISLVAGSPLLFK